MGVLRLRLLAFHHNLGGYGGLVYPNGLDTEYRVGAFRYAFIIEAIARFGLLALPWRRLRNHHRGRVESFAAQTQLSAIPRMMINPRRLVTRCCLPADASASFRL